MKRYIMVNTPEKTREIALSLTSEQRLSAYCQLFVIASLQPYSRLRDDPKVIREVILEEMQSCQEENELFRRLFCKNTEYSQMTNDQLLSALEKKLLDASDTDEIIAEIVGRLSPW